MAYSRRRRRASRPSPHQASVNAFHQSQVEALLGRPVGDLKPVRAEGRIIAHSVWGRAFCTHLERYSDFSNRLPRGRTYLRSGAVLHLDIQRSLITAVVRGSELYAQRIDIAPLSDDAAQTLTDACADNIESTVALLSGHLPAAVMDTLTDPESGLFPEPHEISLHCSCPDGAYLCKHLAAVLYGVAARLDERPDLLFVLRGLDPETLATRSPLFHAPLPSPARRLNADLGALFDIDLAPDEHAADSAAAAAEVGAKERPVRAAAADGASARCRKAKPVAADRSPEPELQGAPTVDADGRLLVSRAFLVAAGLSSGQINSWRRRALLMPSGSRGVYELTPSGWEALEPLLGPD